MPGDIIKAPKEKNNVKLELQIIPGKIPLRNENNIKTKVQRKYMDRPVLQKIFKEVN